MQENHFVDIPESSDATVLTRMVVVEEPAKPIEELDFAHDNALVLDVKLLLQPKAEPIIVEPDNSPKIEIEEKEALQDDSIIDIENRLIPSTTLNMLKHL